MSTMNMPGFTAETSLYKLARIYAATANHAAGRTDALVPALFKYCKNVRPGWVFEATLCGECADFRVRCLGSGQDRTCWYERVGPWQWECWVAEVAG
jgi:hypothetical protein